jgi:hypothetical protein
MATQIVSLILSAMVTNITSVMQTPMSGSDITRAISIKRGRWQDDPTRKFVYVTVCGGDPEEPKVQDGIVSLDGMDNIAMEFPPREVGGGQLWWRRGTCQVGCYFLKQGLNEDAALDNAYVVLGRLESCIESTVVSNLVDTFGEQAYEIFCYANTMFEGGGSPTSYIWRAKISWACLTERP